MQVLDSLPRELKLAIVYWLDASSIVKLARVNKEWKLCCDDQYIWRSICFFSFGRAADQDFWCKKRSQSIGEPQKKPKEDWKERYQYLQQTKKRWKIGEHVGRQLLFGTYVRGLQYQENMLVVGLFDGSVEIIDMEKKALSSSNVIEAHNQEIKCLKFQRDILMTAGYSENAAALWNLSTKQKLGQLPHLKPITCCDINVGENLALTGSDDKTVKLWDLRTNGCIRTVQLENAVYSAKIASNEAIVVGTDSKHTSSSTLHVFPFKTFQSTGAFRLDDPVYRVEMNKNEIGVSSKGSFSIFDWKTGTKKIEALQILNKPIVALQFDDKKVVAGTLAGWIGVYERKGTNLEQEFRINGLTAYLCSVQYDDFKLIADGTNNMIYIRNFTQSPVQQKRK